MENDHSGSISGNSMNAMNVSVSADNLLEGTTTSICQVNSQNSLSPMHNHNNAGGAAHDDDDDDDDNDNDGHDQVTPIRKRTSSASVQDEDDQFLRRHKHIHSSDAEWYRNAFANLRVLKITALSFFLFVVAEVVGAFMSNSLSLLGDASAMSMDVSTYVISIFVEEFKLRNKGAKLSVDTMWLVDVGIPTISVIALLAVTVYISMDAVKVLYNPPKKNDVEVIYLYGFSCANMIVDIISAAAFLNRGDNAFYEEKETVIIRPSSSSFSSASSSGARKRSVAPLQSSSSPRGGEYHALPTASSSSSSSPSTPSSETVSIHVKEKGVVKRKKRAAAVMVMDKNFNMISAWTHVGGDTLRTVAVFAAAFVSSVTGIDGDICDAWAAIVSGLTIIVLVVYLVIEIIHHSRRQGALPPIMENDYPGSYDDGDDSDEEDDGDNDISILSKVLDDIDCNSNNNNNNNSDHANDDAEKMSHTISDTHVHKNKRTISKADKEVVKDMLVS